MTTQSDIWQDTTSGQFSSTLGDIPLNGLLAKITGIDLTAVALTTLYTVPAGKKCIVTDLITRLTSISGGVSVATVACGIAAGNADIVAAAALTGLTAVGKIDRMSPAGTYVVGNAADIIKFNVTIGAVATTAVGEVHLLGYLI